MQLRFEITNGNDLIKNIVVNINDVQPTNESFTISHTAYSLTALYRDKAHSNDFISACEELVDTWSTTNTVTIYDAANEELLATLSGGIHFSVSRTAENGSIVTSVQFLKSK